MTDRIDRRIHAARERLAELPGMLHRAEQDTGYPSGATLDRNAPIRAPGVQHRQPSPGDLTGWDAYRRAANEIVDLLLQLRPNYPTPSWWAPRARDIDHQDQINRGTRSPRGLGPPPAKGRRDSVEVYVRALRANLPPDADRRYRPRTVEHVCNQIATIHSTIAVVIGGAQVPAEPDCETPNCTGAQQHGYRCFACVRWKQRHGDYPNRARSVS